MAALLCEGVACFWSYAGIKKSSIAFKKYCISPDDSKDDFIAARYYWFYHKNCAKPFSENKSIEKALIKKIRDMVINGNKLLKKTYDLKERVINDKLDNEIITEIKKYCGKDYWM